MVPEQLSQKTSFGDLATSESNAVVQASAQYGILKDVVTNVGPSGTAIEAASLYSVTSGTNVAGFGAITTDESLIYRPGQGEKDLFSARFGTPQALSEQFSGLANTTSAIGFGYNGTEFGILLRGSGAIEIQELTVTTPATGAENATVTIDGTGYTVPLTSGTVQHNANEIAISLVSQVLAWSFHAVDDQVIATSLIAAPVAGAFAFSSGTAVAAWAQDAAGVLPDDIWTPRAEWSVGADDGFNPNLINSYKIQVGSGIVFFSIISRETNAYEIVHILNRNNLVTAIILENPTFGHTWYALNRGGTTSVTTEGSFSGLYREGPNRIISADDSIQNTLIGVSTTPIPIVTLRSRLAINGVVNLATAIVRGLQVSSDSSKTFVVTLIRNGTLTDPVFQYIDESTSVMDVDVSATSVSGGDAFSISGLGEVVSDDLDNRLDQGDQLTIAVNVTANPASEFTSTLTFVEDL
jgi:hypothetical protein